MNTAANRCLSGFADWHRGRDARSASRMFEILQYEGPHVVGSNFGKGLGGGIFEFRLDQASAQILARKGKPARLAEPVSSNRDPPLRSSILRSTRRPGPGSSSRGTLSPNRVRW